MTTINPETQIVASSYDELNRIYSYTYQHSDGSQYTVKIPADELQGPRDQRRRQIAQKIITHIQTNPPDNA
jgi:hypothetical protein